MTILMESKYIYTVQKWLLVNRNDETIQFRGDSMTIEMTIIYNEADYSSPNVDRVQIDGLTNNGEDFDKYLPGFDSYSFLAISGKYMLTFPKIGLVDRGREDGRSYFITYPGEDKTHYAVWQMDTDNE